MEPLHLSGHWLFYKVGWGSLICLRYQECCRSVHQAECHLPVRYPERIIIDNGTNLNNTMITALCEQFKIQHHNSSPYWLKINGVVEAAKKISKRSSRTRWWHTKTDMRCYHFLFMVTVPRCAHQNGESPFSQVYDMEFVLPIEVQIPSLRIMKDAGLS